MIAMPEGFLPWNGGGNPAPGAFVRVMFRGSNVPAKPIYPSGRLDWCAKDGPQIVAYKIVMEAVR